MFAEGADLAPGEQTAMELSPGRTQLSNSLGANDAVGETATGVKRRSSEDVRSQADGKRRALSPQVLFRLLCPTARSGSVIGKGGEVINVLRQETGAKIKMGEAAAGCDERIVTISAADTPGSEWSPAQEALFRVHACITETSSDAADSTASRHQPAQGTVTARLLVDASQTGCVLGKGGAIVSRLREATGANIKIVGRNTPEMPLCAQPSDELIQVTGEPARVRDALQQISAQLRNNPPKPASSRPTDMSMSTAAQALAASSGMHLPFAGGLAAPHAQHLANNLMGTLGLGLPLSAALLNTSSQSQPAVNTSKVVFKLLVPAARVGSVIGRGGDVIRRLRQDTGAQILVQEQVAGTEERVVTISAPDSGLQPCAAQEALLRCCTCLMQEAEEPMHQLRIACAPGQVGAVLGKGGQTINSLRADSRAHIRVAGGRRGADASDTPRDAQEQEIIQVEGNFQSCLTAVRGIASLLRGYQLRHSSRVSTSAAGSHSAGALYAHPAVSLPLSLPLQDLAPPRPSSPYLLNPPHRQSSPLHMGYIPRQQLRHPSALQPPPPHRQPVHPGLHPGHERRPLPPQLHAERSMRGGGEPRGYSEGAAVLRLPITAAQAGAVLGKGGANINQIRQITGARVKLHEANRGEGNGRQLELGGTPEQVAAARSLLDAFLLLNHAPPLPTDMPRGAGGPGGACSPLGDLRPPLPMLPAAPFC